MSVPSAAGGRPRVLFVGALPEPVTGQSVACEVLLHALQAQYTVDVVDLSKRGFRQGVDSLARILDVVRIVWRTRQLQKDADIIYLTVSESVAGNVKDLLLYVVCRRKLARMIIHLHGGAGMRRILVDGRHFLRAWNERFLRRLGAAVVLGPRHAFIYRDTVPAERLYTVANFAPDAIFCEVEAVVEKFRDGGPLRLLFLSNLLPGKGHEETLEAYLGLRPSEQELLTIDFAGGFESVEARRAFELRIAPHPQLRYHGVVGGTQKTNLFQSAHLFCLPTYYPYEGQPISILEAYAAGCAVLTTDHSGVCDIFTGGVNGFLVDVRSPESIRDAMRAALSDRAALLTMASGNREGAVRRYRADQFALNMLQVFRQTLDRARANRAG